MRLARVSRSWLTEARPTHPEKIRLKLEAGWAERASLSMFSTLTRPPVPEVGLVIIKGKPINLEIISDNSGGLGANV